MKNSLKSLIFFSICFCSSLATFAQTNVVCGENLIKDLPKESTQKIPDRVCLRKVNSDLFLSIEKNGVARHLEIIDEQDESEKIKILVASKTTNSSSPENLIYFKVDLEPKNSPKELKKALVNISTDEENPYHIEVNLNHQELMNVVFGSGQ